MMSLKDVLRIYRKADDFSADGTSCLSITPRLIKHESLSAAQDKIVKSLDYYLSAAKPITDELIVYRGCAIEDLNALTEHAYPSYMSTSTTIAEACNNTRGCLVKIICPPGTKLLKVSSNEDASLEHDEYLLPRKSYFNMKPWDFNATESIETRLILDNPPKPIEEFRLLTVIPNPREITITYQLNDNSWDIRALWHDERIGWIYCCASDQIMGLKKV